MRTLRQKYDRMAWGIIARKRADPDDKPGQARPSNFPEILYWMNRGSVMWGTTSMKFETAFHNFLDEFYLFKRESFFADEPPKEFSPQQRAFLAATAEYLCRRFRLSCPPWTNKPEYFLPEKFNMLIGSHRPAPEYKRHGILFSSRGLIRL